jgi:hypothetical protein
MMRPRSAAARLLRRPRPLTCNLLCQVDIPGPLLHDKHPASDVLHLARPFHHMQCFTNDICICDLGAFCYEAGVLQLTNEHERSIMDKAWLLMMLLLCTRHSA